MERKLTCIVCPLGCELCVALEDGKVQAVSGNTCPRGKVYAETECISPMRTITTTVRCADGTIIPVKTATPIPKDKIFEAMEIINKLKAKTPINAGDVILDDLFGAKVVATKELR